MINDKEALEAKRVKLEAWLLPIIEQTRGQLEGILKQFNIFDDITPATVAKAKKMYGQAFMNEWYAAIQALDDSQLSGISRFNDLMTADLDIVEVPLITPLTKVAMPGEGEELNDSSGNMPSRNKVSQVLDSLAGVLNGLGNIGLGASGENSIVDSPEDINPNINNGAYSNNVGEQQNVGVWIKWALMGIAGLVVAIFAVKLIKKAINKKS